MEESGKSVTRPADTGRPARPNYLLIWLDKYIGRPHEYLLLKRHFFMTTDPTTGNTVDLADAHIRRSIREGEALPLQLDQVQFSLRAFDNVETCFAAIENNLDKRIFFITSGSKGKIIVPSLVAHFPCTFVTNHFMYIFCGNMNMSQVDDVEPTNDWALGFTDHVLMYDHQNDLMVRIVSDIANYFSAEADRLRDANQLDNALEHYQWSKRMLGRYQKMVPKSIVIDRVTSSDRHIEQIERQVTRQRDNDVDREGVPPV